MFELFFELILIWGIQDTVDDSKVTRLNTSSASILETGQWPPLPRTNLITRVKFVFPDYLVASVARWRSLLPQKPHFDVFGCVQIAAVTHRLHGGCQLVCKHSPTTCQSVLKLSNVHLWNMLTAAVRLLLWRGASCIAPFVTFTTAQQVNSEHVGVFRAHFKPPHQSTSDQSDHASFWCDQFCLVWASQHWPPSGGLHPAAVRGSLIGLYVSVWPRPKAHTPGSSVFHISTTVSESWRCRFCVILQRNPTLAEVITGCVPSNESKQKLFWWSVNQFLMFENVTVFLTLSLLDLAWERTRTFMGITVNLKKNFWTSLQQMIKKGAEKSICRLFITVKCDLSLQLNCGMPWLGMRMIKPWARRPNWPVSCTDWWSKHSNPKSQ